MTAIRYPYSTPIRIDGASSLLMAITPLGAPTTITEWYSLTLGTTPSQFIKLYS
jgi:hypothetical protein